MDFVKPEAAEPARRRVVQHMREGDLVVIYEKHTSLTHVYLKPGEIYQNKFGHFHHEDIIGKHFGAKIYSRTTCGWVYALKPTPELWSQALNTRTQIVNDTDASVILFNLDVFPGCRVVESGTGSGCMTLALARAVYPNGHVFTFEYNKVRAEMAREEFASFGLKDLITVRCQDVCGKHHENSGGFPGVEPSSIDSIFLDLPQPWLALDHAVELLKPSRPICCYSPCMEQVIKTCEKLRALGFYNIRMIEMRLKDFDARSLMMENCDLGHDALQTKDGEGQASSAGEKMDEGQGQGQGQGDVEGDADEDQHQTEIDQEDNEDAAEEEEEEGAKKRARTEPSESQLKPQEEKQWPRKQLFKPKPMLPTQTMVARPNMSMKGHTAFLTFALAPLKRPESTAADAAAVAGQDQQ